MKGSRWLGLVIASCAMEGCGYSHFASERARADLAAGTMVAIAGGKFWIAHGSGEPGEDSTWVSVRSFLLDTTEVTVAAYGGCVRAGRCKPASATVSWDAIREPDRDLSRACNQDRSDRADHPVNCIEWDDAAAYCAWASKRLPTEEEWEFAARNRRAGTAYPWGGAPPAGQPCWSGEGKDAGAGKREGTCAAGSHPADRNAAGVKDLGGGVAEWTSSETVVGVVDGRGRGGTALKVFRGGSWADTDPRRVASSSRAVDLGSRRDARLGFRCASDPVDTRPRKARAR